MPGLPGPFGGSTTDADDFDAYDEFVPANVPEPGDFLQGQDVLAGGDHAAFHRLTRAVFEERGVYDMTFGYNLARLNLDPRHPGAGYRYSREAERSEASDDASGEERPASREVDRRETSNDANGEAVSREADAVLRAEFTPTTPFCPQSDTLTKGSFRAWNGSLDRHEYDLVRVRVDEMHHRAAEINGALERLEAQFRESGVVPGSEHDGRSGGQAGTGPGCGDDGGSTSRGYGPEAPF